MFYKRQRKGDCHTRESYFWISGLKISMIAVTSSDGLYVGYVAVDSVENQNASPLHSFSAREVEGQPYLLDCSTLRMDDGLLRVLQPIRHEAFFVDKLSGCKEPQKLHRDVQGLVNEAASQKRAVGRALGVGSTCTTDGFPINAGDSSSSSSGGNNNNNSSSCSNPFAESFTTTLLRHVAQIGWNRLEASSADMLTLTLSCLDSRGRKHCFQCSFDSSYPRTPPRIAAELPVPVVLRSWPLEGGGDLSLVLAAVQRETEQYSALLDILEDLDKHCCVLEPRRPSFAVTSRRIALQRLCSICIDFPEPVKNPHGLCSVRFLGPPDLLQAYQQSLQEKAPQWRTHTETDRDPSQAQAGGQTRARAATAGSAVRENLELVLGVTLPAPRSNSDNSGASGDGKKRARSRREGEGDSANAEEEEFVTECGICYAFNSSDSSDSSGSCRTTYNTSTHEQAHVQTHAQTLPDQVCPNANCGKMYHRRCLTEWLQAVPSSKQSFGSVFGSCPYCNAWISVKAAL